MHSKSENSHPLEPDAHSIPPSSISSQPWWRGVGYNAPPPVLVGESDSKSSSLEPQDGGMGTKAQSQSVDGLDEGTGVTKGMQATVTSQSDGNYGHEHQHLHHVASTIPSAGGEYLVPHTQLELVGHSVACASYPYSDPYYGGIMTAYGPQTLVHPHVLGMHHPRMPLPLEMAEEPVYVNAKQYHGILRRRQSRAKAELEKKLIKVRKPYLHESRHQHAMRRARGCGGRFLNTKKLQKDATNPTNEKGMDSCAAPSTQSASSTGSEPSPSDCTRNLESSGGPQEVNGCLGKEIHEPPKYSNGSGNGNGCYQHQGFQLSTFHPLSGERGEEGICSGQQRGNISVSQAPHRALTIQ